MLEGSQLGEGSPLLADVLNSEDVEEALLLSKSGDVQMNYRSRRLKESFVAKRNEVGVAARHPL